jgi:FlaA1/EpsC-like NDP-sugar epimerase
MINLEEAMQKNVLYEKCVIITGVTGQDGSHMVDFLLKNNNFETNY